MRSPLGPLLVLGALGCSSSPADEPASIRAAPDTSVFDRCVEFATELCADAEGCCRQAYGDFSPAGCVATFTRDVCRPGADAVAAGKAAFDAEAVDGCLAAHAEAHAVCVPTWRQTLDLRKRIYAECRVINGAAEPGQACAVDAHCRRPAGAATAECVKNVCRAIEVLPEGAACPFPSGSVSVCDDGLTCDAPGLETEGRCVPAVPAGGACDGSVLEGTDCGLGSYCDPDSGTCQLTVNTGGSGCAQGSECVSFECDRLAQECAPAQAVVAHDVCLGAALAP